MVTLLALMQGVFPSVFRQADQARTAADWQQIARRCDRVTLLFVALALLGVGALHLIGPYLVGTLVGESYAPAMSMLMPVGMAAVALQINQFQFLLLQGQQKSASMVRVMVVVAGHTVFGAIFCQ